MPTDRDPQDRQKDPRDTAPSGPGVGEGAGSAGGSDGASGVSAWEHFESQLGRAAAAGVSAPGLPATVLLQGESGSGKSRAARALHDGSPRSSGPFVNVHLAGLAESLIEAELFGHTAGAFTGASGERAGRFQSASGGTIVLDAIETLAAPLQVKLLRVLQERVVEPLGSETPVPVDARVVATSARNLRGLVEAGEFREDLYFRLAVITLEVPPLRVRAGEEDFAGLCEGMGERVAERVRVPWRGLTPEALSLLAEHPWPGNFRELENALERVLVLGQGELPVQPEELAFLREVLAGRAAEVAAEAIASGVGLEELDAAMIDEALRIERGNLAAAARRVGLTRRAFDYRRKRLEKEKDND